MTSWFSPADTNSKLDSDSIPFLPPALGKIYCVAHAFSCAFLQNVGFYQFFFFWPFQHKLQHNWPALCVETVQSHIHTGWAWLPSDTTVIVVPLLFICLIFILSVRTEKMCLMVEVSYVYCRLWRLHRVQYTPLKMILSSDISYVVIIRNIIFRHGPIFPLQAKCFVCWRLLLM